MSSALTRAIAEKISYIILNPPETAPYTELCHAIEQEFGATDNARFTKLLEQCELGDQKPTQLLRKMKDLAGSQVDDAFLFNIFTKKLPSQVCRAILAMDVKDPNLAAKSADLVFEFASPDNKKLHEVQSAGEETGVLYEVLNLLRDLQSDRSRSHSRSRNRSEANRTRSQMPSKKHKQDDYCWYHHKFGVNAKDCRQPCKFNPSSRIPKTPNSTISGDDGCRADKLPFVHPRFE